MVGTTYENRRPAYLVVMDYIGEIATGSAQGTPCQWEIKWYIDTPYAIKAIEWAKASATFINPLTNVAVIGGPVPNGVKGTELLSCCRRELVQHRQVFIRRQLADTGRVMWVKVNGYGIPEGHDRNRWFLPQVNQEG